MAINIILGTPGSGKSYEAVAYHILPAIKEGRKVITNLSLNLDVIYSFFEDANIEIIEEVFDDTNSLVVRPFSRLDHYQDDWKHPEKGYGPLYVIDECHMALRKGSTKQDIQEWFAMHRHEGADVLLITQWYGKVDRSIIENVQVCYRVRKATAAGIENSYIRKVQDGARGEVVDTKIRVYEKKYFKYYKSHTLSDNEFSEATSKDIKKIWMQWPFLLSVPFLFAIPFLIYKGYLNPLALFSNHEKDQVEEVSSLISTQSQIKNIISSSSQLSDFEKSNLSKKEEEPKNKKKSTLIDKTKVHPLKDKNLHIQGWIGNDVKQLYSIAASQNGSVTNVFMDYELRNIGYKIIPLNSCLVEISYSDFFSDYIHCDIPSQELKKVNLNNKS